MATTTHLKCLSGAPVEQQGTLVEEVRSLNALPTAGVLAIFDIARRTALRDDSLDIAAAAAQVCASTGAKPKAVRAGIRALVVVVQGANRHSLGPASLKEDLTALGLDAERCGAVGAEWEREGPSLIQVATDRAVKANSLVDAEWRFGVTVSTDEVGKVGSTFLQMRLLTTPGGGGGGRGGLEAHHLELTIPQFYDLLSQLEKAQSYVTLLGSSG